MTISQRPNESVRANAPGPGTYDQKHNLTKNKSTAAIISPSRQRIQERETSGGPGSYNIG